MTLEEAGKAYGLSRKVLKQYVSSGLIEGGSLSSEKGEYREEDFVSLGLIDTLIKAGFALEEVKLFLTLRKKTETEEEQIRMLRKRRRGLLDHIHEKQRLLDNLDYLIWDVKNRKKEVRR